MINTIRFLISLLLPIILLLNSCCKKHGGSGKDGIPKLTKNHFVCDDFSQSPRCVIDLEWNNPNALPLKLLVKEVDSLSESFNIPNNSKSFKTGTGGIHDIIKLKGKPISYALVSNDESGHSYIPELDSSLVGQGVYVYSKTPSVFSENLSKAISNFPIRYIYLSMGEFNPNDPAPILYDPNLTKQYLENWKTAYQDAPLRLIPFIDSQTQYLAGLTAPKDIQDYANKIGTIISKDPSVSGVGFDLEAAHAEIRSTLRLFFNYLAQALYDYASKNHVTQKILVINPSYSTFYDAGEDQNSEEVKNWIAFLTGNTCKRENKNYCLAVNMEYDLTGGFQSYKDYVESFCSGNSVDPLSQISFFQKHGIPFQYGLPGSASATTATCNNKGDDLFTLNKGNNVFAQVYSKASSETSIYQSDFVISGLNYFSCFLTLCKDESTPPESWLKHSYSNELSPEWIDDEDKVHCRLVTQAKDGTGQYNIDYINKIRSSLKGFVYYRLSDLNEAVSYPSSLEDKTCNDPETFADKLNKWWVWAKDKLADN